MTVDSPPPPEPKTRSEFLKCKYISVQLASTLKPGSRSVCAFLPTPMVIITFGITMITMRRQHQQIWDQASPAPVQYPPQWLSLPSIV